MNTRVYDFLVKQIGITDKALLRNLACKGKIAKFKKREIIFRQNECPQYVAFLYSGIVRGFLVDENNNEITDCFCFKYGDAVVPSLPFDAPAYLFIQALVESELLMFPISDIVSLVNNNTDMMKLYNFLLQESNRKHFEIKCNITRFNNVQRYMWFLEEYPNLIDEISHKYIASFLGMTEVSLSRARRELAKRNKKQM